MGKRLDFALGVLNGAIGQHLSRTDNALSTTMAVYVDGLSRSNERVVDGFPEGANVAVFVHGIMGTEQIWDFADGSEDYGAALQALGYVPIKVRYNSGRAIADNGASLSVLLAELVASGKIASLTLVGHSMGGLVLRSAFHAGAGSAWLPLVRRAIYLGTPHRGAPLERAGKLVHRVLTIIDQPYTRLVADVADLRSDGMKDLGDVHPVPLSARVKHHVVAGTLFEAKLLGELLGDALVPVSSAIDGVTDSLVLQRSHNALAHDARVRDQIVEWCRS